jgi:hypothetical protein
MKKCQSISNVTNQRCKKGALLGSKYCILHIDKTSLIIGALLGAFVSLVLTELWHSSFPSPELKSLRKQQKTINESENNQRIRAAQLTGQVSALQIALMDQRKEMSTKLDEVQNQLEPFIKLAKNRYPNYELPKALEMIIDELNDVRELASRDILKNPSDTILNMTFDAMKKWHSSYPDYQIEVSLLNAQTYNTENVITMVFYLLKSCKIKNTFKNKSYISIGRRSPITISSSLSNKEICISFINALSNYVTGNIYFQEDSTMNINIIDINFCGIPKFYNDGRVILE